MKSINEFFKETDKSCEKEIECILLDSVQVPGVLKTINEYQEMLRKQSDVKKSAKIVTSSVGASECWKFFGHLYISNKIVLENYKFCSICFSDENIILKGFGLATSTTNYSNHLRNYHNADVKSLTNKKNKELTTKGLTTNAKSNSFVHARRLTEMCCIDLQPFNTVERIGFQKYVSSIDSNIKFPTAKTLGSSALNDVYDVYLDHVQNIMAKCPDNITLVLDMWTDKFKKLSYINIKIHFSEDFVIRVASLNTEHFPHPHTAKAVGEKVVESLKYFGLQTKKIRAVSDGGSNIVAALKNKNILRFNCMSHTLHRFLTHDILNNPLFEALNKIILKLKKIFRALTYRGEEIEKLQQLKQNETVYDLIQQVTNCFEMDENFTTGSIEGGNVEADLEEAIKTSNLQSLKNSVETRWSSILKMIQSFDENVDVINMILLKIKREELLIPEMERQIIKEFANFLEIFSDATTYLQGQKYPTISSCIYFFERIYSNLVERGDDSSFGIIIHLYDFAKQNFFKRFEILKIHVVAALMDPCQKNWSILNNYLKRLPDDKNLPDNFVLKHDVEDPITKEKLVLMEIFKYKMDESPSSSSSCDEPAKKKEKVSGSRKKMLKFLSGTEGSDAKDPLKLEIQKYFDCVVGEVESLDWWKENQRVFPTVAKLANLHFGVPATSASSEIAF